MDKFDFKKWQHTKCITKEEAKQEIDKLGIIGNEIEDIIILDKDIIAIHPYNLFIIYVNDVLHEKNEDRDFWLSKQREFMKQHDTISLEDFPKDFKYSCPTYSNMPLLLKMKNGDYIELFFWEHFENKESVLTWTSELLLSKNELKECVKKATPALNYNKLYSFILNKKIVDVNFDFSRYVNLLENKLDSHNKLNEINIEFENGYVMELIKSAPDKGYLIMIWNNNSQTNEIFSINDFSNCFLGNIEDINKVHH